MKFEEALNALGVQQAHEGHHHTRAGWINFDCPFCGRGSHKYHMGYNKWAAYVNCWRCGPHKIIDTLVELGMPWRDAREVYHGLERDYKYEKPKRGTLKLPKHEKTLLPRHIRYLAHRGFDPNRVTRLWDLRGIGINARLPWRILIPIYFRSEIVSWTTRAVGSGLRYISASAEEESINHKELLYGEDFLSHSVIVHEGPLDVWATGPGAVALCGTSYTTSQLGRLSRYPKRIVCFDSEPDAQKRAKRLCDDLEVFPGDTINVVLESGKDAAEADPDELKQLRKLL